MAVLAEHESMHEQVMAAVSTIEPRESRVILTYDALYNHAAVVADVPEEDDDLFGWDRSAEFERIDAGRAELRSALGTWDESGFADRLRTLRDSGGVFVKPLPRKTPLVDVSMPELGQIRRLAQAVRARKFLAVDLDDWDTYIASVEDGLFLARVLDAQPVLINGLVSVAVRSLILEGVRLDVLGRRLPADVLNDLAEALAEVDAGRPEFTLEGELLWGLDSVQRSHDRRGRLMLSQLAVVQGADAPLPPIVNLASIVMPRRETTERAFRSYYGRLIELASLTPAERRAGGDELERIEESIDGKQVLLRTIVPAMDRAVQSFDAAAVDLVGLRTLIAIERFRAERGELPAALAELVPEYLDAEPADPWAESGALVYRLNDSELGYVLYSIGGDGEDNDAARPEKTQRRQADQRALTGRATGTDYVFTRLDTAD
ncbi:MAG: hypothetical protein AAFS11_09010, partial [Planctomycetota bacterium]